MATNPIDASAKTTISPPFVGSSDVKRGRSEDGEQPTRRVSQRTEGDDEAFAAKSVATLINEDLGSEDEGVLVKALNRLVSLLLHSNDETQTLSQKKADFFQVGGHAIVVRTMKKHQDCEGIQANGIAVLANVSRDNNDIEAPIRKVKGIETILEAMKKFPLSRDVIRSGISALANLTSNHEGNADILVQEIDAAPFIIGRMNHFSGDEEVTCRSCFLLANLCSSEQLREKLIAVKAGSALFAAVEGYPNNGKIQMMSKNAIKSLVA